MGAHLPVAMINDWRGNVLLKSAFKFKSILPSFGANIRHLKNYYGIHSMHPVKEYVLNNFFLVYDSPPGLELDFDYGDEAGTSPLKIAKNHADFFELDELPCNPVWRNRQGTNIPVFFADGECLFQQNENGNLLLCDDIPANIFFWLSGWQETVIQHRDEHGRFCYADSLQHTLGTASLPVVAYLFDLLREGFERAYKIQLQKKQIYTGGAVCITHDVDRWQRVGLRKYKWALKNCDWRLPVSTLYKSLRFGHLHAGHEQMMLMAQKYAYQATLFFITSPPPPRCVYPQGDYSINYKRVKEAIKKFKSAGHQIGYHFGFDTCRSPEKLSAQMQKPAADFEPISRFHYLQFDILNSPAALQNAGIKLDSTLGFAEQAGFRNGTCFPFYLYLHRERKCSTVLELPLVVMDVSLSAGKYMNCTPKQMQEVIDNLWNEVKKVHGCMVFNLHNDSYEVPQVLEYGHILEYIPQLSANKLKLSDFLAVG